MQREVGAFFWDILFSDRTGKVRDYIYMLLV